MIGGYILTVLATLLGIDLTGALTWIVYIAGGILGLIFVSVLFDWALITLSSLAGASLVIQAFSPQAAVGGILFFILFILGVIIQGSVLRYERGAVVTHP